MNMNYSVGLNLITKVFYKGRRETESKSQRDLKMLYCWLCRWRKRP